MKEYLTQTLRVPGTEAELTYRRSPQGRLVALTYQKTTYVRELGEVRILGDGLARMSEIGFNRRCLRHVQGGGQAWVEHYVWDEDGRLVEVDGVQVRRDERGRIVACESEFGRWTYTYGGDHLVTIKSPLGHRRFTRGQDGRPLARHEHNATFTIG